MACEGNGNGVPSRGGDPPREDGGRTPPSSGGEGGPRPPEGGRGGRAAPAPASRRGCGGTVPRARATIGNSVVGRVARPLFCAGSMGNPFTVIFTDRWGH